MNLRVHNNGTKNTEKYFSSIYLKHCNNNTYEIAAVSESKVYFDTAVQIYPEDANSTYEES